MIKKTPEDFGGTDLEFRTTSKRFNKIGLMIGLLPLGAYAVILLFSFYSNVFREIFWLGPIILISSMILLFSFTIYMAFFNEDYKRYLSYVNYLRQYKLLMRLKEKERKRAAKEVQLISPKFNQLKKFPLGLNKLYLLTGPFGSLINKRWLEFFVVLIASILTLGIAWIIFAFKVNKIIVRRKIHQGYIPARDEDRAILETLMKGEHFEVDSIKLSRLGSVDGNVKNK